MGLLMVLNKIIVVSAVIYNLAQMSPLPQSSSLLPLRIPACLLLSLSLQCNEFACMIVCPPESDIHENEYVLFMRGNPLCPAQGLLQRPRRWINYKFLFSSPVRDAQKHTSFSVEVMMLIPR